MNAHSMLRISLPGQIAALVLACAMGVPALAQQAQSAGSTVGTTPSTVQQQSTTPTRKSLNTPKKEGFWGHLNPFARKKWVKRMVDPIKGRLSELDQVNAKNARDIKDVNARAQAGIHKAQSTADAANQTAMNATNEAQQANNTALGASSHVNQLNTTINGLDQYRQAGEIDVAFLHDRPVLSEDAREQLDGLASGLAGHEGYIIEIRAHAPGAGSVGIQRSQRMVEAVERYLVIDHQIPIYRMHSVALGNIAPDAGQGHPAYVRKATVQIRLMENSLAAKAQ